MGIFIAFALTACDENGLPPNDLIAAPLNRSQRNETDRKR